VEKIKLILEFEPKVTAAIRRIAEEDQMSVGAVLKEAILRGLAKRAVHGPDPKTLFTPPGPKGVN
jgi:hypothetical protein